MAQHYIGTKQITAWPEEKDKQSGYAVRYPDGYTSWSPRDTFEAAYFPMGELEDGSKITEKMVDGFIQSYESQTIGEKNTVVRAVLLNGFEIIESSSCVDPKNYDEELGTEICLKRIKDISWLLLGFTLLWASTGIQ